MAIEQQPTRVHHLNILATIRSERTRALTEWGHAEFAAALDARLEGATWAEVGGALGVSAQAAQQRFHGRH